MVQADIDRLVSHLQTKGGISVKDDVPKKLKPLSPASLRKVKFMLKQVFDYAIDPELIIKNLAQRVKLPKLEKPPMKPLEQSEIKKLLEAAEDSPMYIPLLLDLSTGLRRGELLALQWKDVDLDAGIINVHRQLVPVTGGVKIKDTLKTDNSTRQVGLPDKTIVELRKCKDNQEAAKEDADTEYFNAGQDEDLVVCQDNCKHWHPRNFARKFDQLLTRTGIAKRKVNDMRHTFATQLLTSGAYISEVQESLGHTDAKTTLQNYSHILPGRQKELANRMNNILPDMDDKKAAK